MDSLLIDNSDVIIIAVLVLWLGNLITSKVALLRTYSIPIAVTGGLIYSFAVAAVGMLGGPTITFDLHTRDLLLLVFFSTIGLSAKLSKLRTGGKALGILVPCAGAFLAIQNVTGVILAKIFGTHPAIGLFAGSVSLAGGHGTAIAWGQEAAAAGVANAEMVGVAFATFGLIFGGIIGGPVAEFLIKRNGIQPEVPRPTAHDDQDDADVARKNQTISVTLYRTLRVLLILAVCVSLGDVVNRWFFANDIKLPGFLTSMMVGIVITNFLDRVKRPLVEANYEFVGEISLQLFLAMSLMSMDLSSLAAGIWKIMIVLFVQMAVITLFSVYLIFRVMGRDYDAAVIAGGFCGLGMGATPVAIANMNAITAKYGPSFKAFLVIPLVGAFFIDLLNAVIIKFFLGLPMMQLATDLPAG